MCAQALGSDETVGGKRAVTGVKKQLKESAAYPEKMGISIISAWKNNSGANQLKGLRSTGLRSTSKPSSKGLRSTGLKSKLRQTAAHRDGRETSSGKRWASLALEEASGSMISVGLVEGSHSWETLDIEDAVDAEAPAAQQSSAWQTLDLEDDGMGSIPEPLDRCAWHRLALEED